MKKVVKTRSTPKSIFATDINRAFAYLGINSYGINNALAGILLEKGYTKKHILAEKITKDLYKLIEEIEDDYTPLPQSYKDVALNALARVRQVIGEKVEEYKTEAEILEKKKYLD